ncbi:MULTISPECIES: AMP-binding protein [unclassified Delftia]|uniref:AMP-binding protein n=1 Tax=unclassified Delftia TaxID=2613839 RepID=UPI00190280B7|nr:MULTISPECIES: AMP-binding protein [unclassified Delftia]MBK0114043.1 AMP-binding protein [Delftia sp. S65]MBK0117851.1 AMP-binding protein [Delftia sp. S67]MBK0129150.1 AMP-binding protein [Delftia sp. S66]
MINLASGWCGPTACTLVLRALQRFPERTAFSWDGGSLRYGAALDLIGRLQGVLKAAGHEPRVVALLSANRAEAWCAEVAVQALGLAVTWLHPMGALPDQLEQLHDSGAAALVVDGRAFGQRGAELAALAPQLQHVWTLGKTEAGVDLLAAAQSIGPVAARDLSLPSSVATMNYTGGTTGRSKAVLRQQHAHAAMWRAILEDFELPARPNYLAAAPISHVAGTKIAPVLLRGGTVHLLQRFEPDEFLATVQAQSINMSLLVPTMVYTLLDEPRLAARDLSSLELLLYGASPMSPTRLVEAMERIGPVFSQLYGQTECYPISLLRKGDHDAAQPERFASCGAPIASVEVRLLDDSGQSVPQGEAGEICVRAPHVMNGYWQRDELTREASAGGWLHTSDIARMDERGFLFIVDRKKDMIVSGGFNVYPREVEDVLTSDPSVASAAVIGVPDAKWGETVLAVVVARPGAVIDADALAQLVKQRKGAQHAPKRVQVVDALPLTALGKVDKKALRAPHWPTGGRQVA